MDLAVFIGELLGQQDTLSVPGLGKFTRVHRDSYYDDDRGIFYPPHFETSFEEQKTDDPTLAQYISSKKGISVNSADYFIDKYVLAVKQQAKTDEVQLDQLGWVKLQGMELSFTPNHAPTTYEQEYFGFPPLNVQKIWEQLSGYRKPQPETRQPAPQPAKPSPVATPPPTPAKASVANPVAPVETAPVAAATNTVPAPPVQAPVQVTEPATPELSIFPEVLTLKNDTTANPSQHSAAKSSGAAESTSKSAISGWLLIVIIVVVLGIILLALYKYRHSLTGGGAGASIQPVSHQLYTALPHLFRLLKAA